MKLKPCPFCENKVEYDEEAEIILCSECGFYYSGAEHPNKTSLFAFWNNRPKTGLEKLKKWLQEGLTCYHHKVTEKVEELLKEERKGLR